MATFRKSTKIGPVRLTFSPKGVSTSVGVKGARLSKGADGKVRRTLSIPGTGIYDTKVVGSTSRPAETQSPTPCAEVHVVSEKTAGMTMLQIQEWLNEAAAAGVPADAVPTVEISFRGRIKRFKV